MIQLLDCLIAYKNLVRANCQLLIVDPKFEPLNLES